MKAWRVHELGEARDVLRFEENDDPVPGTGQVLVRVLAAPANFPDVLLCRGEYQIKPPLPFTPGVELCGEVVAVGDGSPVRPSVIVSSVRRCCPVVRSPSTHSWIRPTSSGRQKRSTTPRPRR